jgi:hypothetical protein
MLGSDGLNQLIIRKGRLTGATDPEYPDLVAHDGKHHAKPASSLGAKLRFLQRDVAIIVLLRSATGVGSFSKKSYELLVGVKPRGRALG